MRPCSVWQAAQQAATQVSTKSSASSGTYSGKVGDQVSNSVPALRHSHVTSQGISAWASGEEKGGLEGRASPISGRNVGPPQSSHIHQKHFFFTFLLFLRKSCFSGTGASAGDLGGEGASSAGSASSRFWRTSWNLPSCCRKSYSTLEDRAEGRRVASE